MAKKTKELTLEEKLEQALVPVEEHPYELPNNWCWVKPKSIFSIEYGKGISTKELLEEGYPVFGANGMIGFCDKYMYKEPKALMSCRGAYSGKMNVSCEKAFVSSNSLIIDSKDERLDYKFIYYLFSAMDVTRLISGTAQPQVTVQAFDNYAIPLPPLAEQQRIVDRIESLFAKLDEAKEKVEIVLGESENRRAAVFDKAYKGILTKKWRSQHTDELKNTVIDDYQEKAKSFAKKDSNSVDSFSVYKEVIEIDENTVWYNCKIGTIAIVGNGSTPSRKCDKYWNGDINWVSSGEIRNNIISTTKEQITQEGYSNSSVKLLPKGTVLIAMIGEGKTRGQSSILDIEATINQNIASIQIDNDCIDSKFLWYWLQKQYKVNREKGSGTGPQALNCQRVRELDFVVPSLAEQKEIVCILDLLIQAENEVSQKQEDILDEIDVVKKSVLAKAFRGELGTNDPLEESATELLKQVLV